jgi:uncharacterized membrane protein YesL
MKAFFIMGRILKALYDDLFLYVWLSALWWLGTVLILPAGPVTSGLHRVANRSANYKRVNVSFFYESVRQRIGRSWLLFAGNGLVILLLIFNITFYLDQQTLWLRAFGFAWIWVLIIFLLMGQYFFPLFWQQEEPNIRLVLRNAFLLTLRNPLYTLFLFLFQVLIITFSFITVLPVLLLMPAAIAVTANYGLVGMLQEMDLAPPPPS